MRTTQRGLFLCLLVAALIGSGCGPGSSVDQAPSSRPPERKVLTVAHQGEPVAFIPDLQIGIQSETSREVQYLLHDDLVVELEYENVQPQLALELPSLNKGTWQIHPDGSMDTTWKLRPGVAWHDGEPFTSADLLFSFQLFKDKELTAATSTTSRMESAAAPDPTTFTIRWSALYAQADVDSFGSIVPKHLLESPYQSDKSTLPSHPFFRTEFVGLGPYRLTTWEPGSYLEVVRFDGYYQGRPPLDSIVVRFVFDPTTATANILSGTVDIVISSSSQGIDLDTAADIRRRWEGTGNQVLVSQTGRVLVAEPQFRAEFARPREAMSNLAVRQALSHATDREGLAQVMTHGLAPPADSYFLPFDPLRPQVDSFIAKYPYDPSRARQLLAQAGWTAGPDGSLVQLASGERFQIEIWARQGAGNDKIAAIMADNWKAIGIDAITFTVSPAMRADRAFESTRPGFLIINPSGTAYFERVAKLHSRSIPTPENGWRGSNYGAYSNPRLDTLIDQLQETVDPQKRVAIHQELVREHMANAAFIPLFWQVAPVLALAGVKGPRANQKRTTANIFEWDKTR